MADTPYGLTCGRPAAIRETGILKGAGLKSIRIVLAVAAALMALSVAAGSAAALEPPLPGELAKFRQDGSLPRRLARAREFGTEGIVPGMLKAAVQRLQRSALGAPTLRTPPPAWRGMPTKGTVNVLAVPVSFSDYPPYSSQADLQDRLFGDGDPAAFPYESVHDYYARSSYGQLDIEGDVLPWYDTGQPRSAVGTSSARREALIESALDAYAVAHPGWDASKYDNNGDGAIDYLVVIWTGPHTGWSGFWWGYQTQFSDFAYSVGGSASARTRGSGSTSTRAGRLLTAPTTRWSPSTRRATPSACRTTTTTTPAYGPDGGIGGLDMMDFNWGDHNVFSKWLLDWLTPQVVTAAYGPVTLTASATAPDALVVMPGVRDGDAFQEYFMVENKLRTANNSDMPTDGLVIWHVDARLDPSTGYQDYLYDNSYTSHKLLRLMEADGLEEIEAGGWADAGDFYKTGKTLGPATRPSGYAYGKAKAVVVRDIISAADPMGLFASTDWAPPSTTVSGAPAGWTRSPVTLSLLAADDVSGVASTAYRLDGGAWTDGSGLSLPADPATHDGDGVHAIVYRSTDNAGNVEADHRLTVRIDTAGPTCRAPLASGVRRGGVARLSYSVSDALSPRADVTIKVRRLDGAAIRTLRAAGVTTGVRHTKAFACPLARGAYRYQVRAVDLAGNPQTTAGWNTLRVR